MACSKAHTCAVTLTSTFGAVGWKQEEEQQNEEPAASEGENLALLSLTSTYYPTKYRVIKCPVFDAIPSLSPRVLLNETDTALNPHQHNPAEKVLLCHQAGVQWYNIYSLEPLLPGFKQYSCLSLPIEMGFHHVGQAGFELQIHLPRPPKVLELQE
ncbi:UPF0764 protein C16orf89 [Plecturocebus cupreus]